VTTETASEAAVTEQMARIFAGVRPRRSVLPAAPPLAGEVAAAAPGLLAAADPLERERAFKVLAAARQELTQTISALGLEDAAKITKTADRILANLDRLVQSDLGNTIQFMADQEKAAADAKAAEEVRIAAERTKQAAQEQVAAAERKQVAADDMAAAGKPAETKMAAIDASAIEPAAPKAIERTQGPSSALPTSGPSPAELAKSVQAELRRVGCLTADADGEWNASSRRSLTLFNKHAGTKFDTRLASLDALDAIKLRPARVCPLICEHGFRPDGDKCSRIVCAEGSFLNDDNECEKRRARTPSARREPDERPSRAARERPQPEPRAARPQASGQIVCDDHLCRPVERGCHIEYRTTLQGGPKAGGGGNVQICPP